MNKTAPVAIFCTLVFALALTSVRADDALTSLVDRTVSTLPSVQMSGTVDEQVPQDVIDKIQAQYKADGKEVVPFPAHRTRIVSYTRAADGRYHYKEDILGQGPNAKGSALASFEYFWDGSKLTYIDHVNKVAWFETSPQQTVVPSMWIPENFVTIAKRPLRQFAATNGPATRTTATSPLSSGLGNYRIEIPMTVKQVQEAHPDATMPAKLATGPDAVLCSAFFDFVPAKEDPSRLARVQYLNTGNTKVLSELVLDEIVDLPGDLHFPAKLTRRDGATVQAWSGSTSSLDAPVLDATFQCRIPQNYTITDRNIDVTYRILDVQKGQ